MSEEPNQADAPVDAEAPVTIRRRTLLRIGAAGSAMAALGAAGSVVVPDLRRKGQLSADGLFDRTSIAWADSIYKEVFPTSPLIVSPFTDELDPRGLRALRPVAPDELNTWAVRPNRDQQNSFDPNSNNTERHQKWSTDVCPYEPLVYKIDMQIASHAFTTSYVLPINSSGQPTVSFNNGAKVAAGVLRSLPRSTIYGFNGTFPGPRINAEYGHPLVVRFRNRLHENPDNLDCGDFGSPDKSALIHLHNAHTAPESDGNPNYSMRYGPKAAGFPVDSWVDQLYLNWPAGGDEREKQSFFWFHDHRMNHTGANVYKGMVGLFPIYDPVLDSGEERDTSGLRLPGRRTDYGDGSFDVDYDIPLALFDCRIDDGVTIHKDIHDSLGEYPLVKNPSTHPEWWGKTFYKHFPNHGFVGDLFTVNGVAYPVMRVKRRKYRLRFLDASISRIYELKLMTSTQGPKSAASLGYTGDDLQGQYRIPDGQQCMKFTQIASDGGLLPLPIVRDSFELWPAKRREFIVDFSKYVDGSTPDIGAEIYLTNVMKMPDGRMWSNSSRFAPDPAYKVPMMKFIVEGDPPEPDQSVIPTGLMRDLPPLPANWQTLMNERLIFEVQRGSAGGETEWLINGKGFDPSVVSTSLKNPAGKTPPASQKRGSFNLWEIRNGGGGWVHPFHLHMEEHRTVMRNGKITVKADAGHPEDASREDLVALDPKESVIVYRGFRDFVGPYVAHCHNLVHEDHSMMFGWEITP